MENHALYPFHEEASWLERHCKLLPHVGIAGVRSHGGAGENSAWGRALSHWHRMSGAQPKDPASARFSACFLVPTTGQCLIFLRSSSEERLHRDFGEGLTVAGDSPDGPFEMTCPRYYVEACSRAGEGRGWAVATPVNGPATISYGPPRPVAKVAATINNFDFDHGNVRASDPSVADGGVLRVEAAGRAVDFAWRDYHLRLRQLVDAGVVRSTALTTFSFAAQEGETEEDLESFTHDVASLCSIVAQQHTGIPVLTFLDAEARVVRRVVGNPVESAIRSNYIVPHLPLDGRLPRLFRKCFEEHRRMQKSDRWKQLPAFCASVEDPPYLEQKFASLMAAVEFLLRNSLLESGGHQPEQFAAMQLPQLIGAAKKVLGWDIPKHYTAGDRHRLLRNAVAHGEPLPPDIDRVRHDFDKWRLFLMRRVLIRLGYDGPVVSPREGWAASSRVDEFSEGHNSFES